MSLGALLVKRLRFLALLVKRLLSLGKPRCLKIRAVLVKRRKGN